VPKNNQLIFNDLQNIQKLFFPFYGEKIEEMEEIGFQKSMRTVLICELIVISKCYP